MNGLERRIQKLEKSVGDLPCKNPEHGNLAILFYGLSREKDEDNDRLLQSLRECRHCRATFPLCIIFRQFPEHPQEPDARLRKLETSVEFNFGKAEDQPQINVRFNKFEDRNLCLPCRK